MTKLEKAYLDTFTLPWLKAFYKAVAKEAKLQHRLELQQPYSVSWLELCYPYLDASRRSRY